VGDFCEIGVGALSEVKGLAKWRRIYDIDYMSKSMAKKQTLKELVEHAKDVGIPPEEVRQIREVVKEHRFPPDVQAVELGFGRDWAGGPAAWISYFVEDDLLLALHQLPCRTLIGDREPASRPH
jgi:hypothetical protein